MSLRMVQLAVEPAKLYAWARLSGLTLQDQGYLVHSALRKAFGEEAPQPFVVLESGDTGLLTVLGYCRAGKEDLARKVAELAQPLLAEALLVHCLALKDMPPIWPQNAHFGFRVRCCPIVRTVGGSEKDVFLAAREKGGAGGTAERQIAYVAWLGREMARNGAAEVISASMRAFRLVRPVRRKTSGALPKTIGIRPETILEGTLAVKDSKGFAALLERGVGRHRAFGYGMLLLSPAKG